MAEVAVYSVIHPGSMRFLPHFWQSLEPQITGGFAVCLTLDSVEAKEVTAVTGQRDDLRLMEASMATSSDRSPAAIRQRALETLVTEFSGIIFVDSDDVLLPGRLGAARTALLTHDVHACALVISDESGASIDVAPFTLDSDELIELREGTLLARMNAFGFGNSAYRSEVLKDCLEMPTNTVLMDWLVASRAYLLGANFTFDPVPRMKYRQYGSNTASVLAPFSPERVLRDARRVVDHYGLLLDNPYGSVRSAVPFQEARDRMTSFLEWLEVQGGRGEYKNLLEYTNRLNTQSKQTYLWWQHVTSVASEPAAGLSHGLDSKVRKERDTA